MDEKLRQLQREWDATGAPEVGARLLHQLRLSPPEALRHALFEHEAVRRSYADLLGDEPLARLIRAQLDLGRDDLPSEQRSRLTLEEAELLEAHGPAWAGARAARLEDEERAGARPRFGPVHDDDDAWELRGGRLVRCPIRVLARDLVERGAAVFGRAGVAPLIVEGMYEASAVHAFRLEHVRRRYGPEEWAERVARCEALELVEDLSLWSYNLGDAHTRRLLESPHLVSVRSLALVFNAQTHVALEPLRDAPHLAQLRRLAFERLDDQSGPSNLDDEAARTLAGARHLEQLERLELPFARVGADGALALIRSERLSSLRHLTIPENPLGPEGAERLAAEPRLGRLTSLDLSCCELGDEGLRVLLGSPHVRHLERLAVSDAAGVEGEAPTELPALDLPRARSISLALLRLGDAGLTKLAHTARLPHLRSVDLSSCEIADAGLEALATSPLLDGLEELDLRSNPIGDRGLEALASSPRAAALRVLRLGSRFDATFSAGAIASLARSPHLGALNTLDLGDLEPTLLDDAASALLASPHLQRLTALVLPSDGRHARERLRARWGDRVRVGAY